MPDKLSAAGNPPPGERPVYATGGDTATAVSALVPDLRLLADGDANLERERLDYLQKTLCNLLPATVMADLPDSPDLSAKQKKAK
jgi:hypothetical protein